MIVAANPAIADDPGPVTARTCGIARGRGHIEQRSVMNAHQPALPTGTGHHAARIAILILIAALALAGVLAGLDALLTHIGSAAHLAATNGNIHIGG
jgi:hypothetical protein